MAQVKGDTAVKFGIEGASNEKIGIVESITVTHSYETTVEAKNAAGEFDSEAAVNMRGDKTDVVISGLCKTLSMPKPGDTVQIEGGNNISSDIPSSMYCVSSEVTGSVGDFVKCTITGVGGADLA